MESGGERCRAAAAAAARRTRAAGAMITIMLGADKLHATRQHGKWRPNLARISSVRRRPGRVGRRGGDDVGIADKYTLFIPPTSCSERSGMFLRRPAAKEADPSRIARIAALYGGKVDDVG